MDTITSEMEAEVEAFNMSKFREFKFNILIPEYWK